jgi:hypothetical protein
MVRLEEGDEQARGENWQGPIRAGVPIVSTRDSDGDDRAGVRAARERVRERQRLRERQRNAREAGGSRR